MSWDVSRVWARLLFAGFLLSDLSDLFLGDLRVLKFVPDTPFSTSPSRQDLATNEARGSF